jgi:PleD family two-component response regulator
MLTNMLSREGYNIITACDGMEAYKAVIINKPKLVITDKEMPKFSGYALLDSLKSIPETNRIPVILLSGSNNPDEEADAYEKGFFDYISKPVRELTLKAKVKRALRSHSHLISFYP